MSSAQLSGHIAQPANAPFAYPLPAPRWRYLWLFADADNTAALHVWWTGPAGNRAPDLIVAPGQQKLVDAGAIVARAFYVSSASNAAFDCDYVVDVEPIAVDSGSTDITGATVTISGSTVDLNVTVAGGQSGAPVTINQTPTALAVPASGTGMALPVGTAAVLFWWSGTATGNIGVTGDQTGITYVGLTPAGDLSSPFLVDVDPDDTSITPTYSAGHTLRAAAFTVVPSAPAPVLQRIAPFKYLQTGVTKAFASPSVLSGAGSGTITFTVLNIPGPAVWQGSLWMTTTPSSMAACSAQLQTAGTGVYPAAGTALLAQNFTAGGAGRDASADDVIVVAPAGTSVQIVTEFSAPPATCNAGANGLLL